MSITSSQSDQMVAKNGGRKKNAEKQFVERNCLLIERYESNQDINTIYNLFGIILIGLVINTSVYHYLETGEFNFGCRLIVAAFNKIHIVLFIWIALFILACFTYLSFVLWAQTRVHLTTPKLNIFWDRLGLLTVIIYYCTSFYAIQKTISFFGFHPGSAAILGLELVRLLMKQHAFLRTNIPKITSYKPHTEQPLIIPDFSKYLYFLFAPTLIYRDEYPRTDRIRWRFVFFNLLELIGVVFLLAVTTERFLVPYFKEVCLREYKLSEILIPVVTNWFPGVIYFLCGFYSVLHSSQNAFAELLRFADRQFYKEWWTCISMSEYYKTWNTIVQDWLFAYVYKDVEYLFPRRKILARLSVFLLSLIVHEWLFIVVLNLFFPVQFIQFLLAGPFLSAFNILQAPIGNFLFWFSIVLGTGMQVNLYTLEYFARLNCPFRDSGVGSWDFFKPRFSTCDCFH